MSITIGEYSRVIKINKIVFDDDINGFVANINISLGKIKLNNAMIVYSHPRSFIHNLEQMYKTLAGNSTLDLNPTLGDKLELSVNHLGHVIVSGKISDYCCDSDHFSVNFSFKTDQSFLPYIIDDFKKYHKSR
jgi:hypothetical protein